MCSRELRRATDRPAPLRALAGIAVLAVAFAPAGRAAEAVARAPQEPTKHAVLFLAPKADAPAHVAVLQIAKHPDADGWLLFDGDGHGVEPVAGEAGAMVVALRAPAGRTFTPGSTAGSIKVWDSADAVVALAAPLLEWKLDGGKPVLLDDDLRAIAMPDELTSGAAPIANPGGSAAAVGPQSIGHLFGLIKSGLPGKPDADALQAALDNPQSNDRVLETLLSSGAGLALLEDLDLELKLLDDGAGGETLGIGYAFRKSFNPGEWRVDEATGTYTGVEYDFSAEGNVAFDSEFNPKDFLKSTFKVSAFRSAGGLVSFDSDDERKAFATRFNAAGDKLVDATGDAWVQAGRELMELYQSRASTIYYAEFGLNASFESNQDFTEKNYTFGAHAGFSARDARPDSPWSRFNVVDYPAAVLRLLTGRDDTFQPRGNATPWLNIGLDHVTPQGDDPRADAGDDSDYWRLTAELAYRAPFAQFDGVDWYLGASWRYYRELDPSDAVEGVDQDAYSRVVVSLASAKGLFASYSSGRLPFDERNEDVFELGWNVNY